jgi:glycerophosphoryl diester phosphodiesterase
LVYINSTAQFTGWRKAAPQMPLMLSMPDSVKTVAAMENFIDKYHPDILDGSYNQYTNEMVALAALNTTSRPGPIFKAQAKVRRIGTRP